MRSCVRVSKRNCMRMQACFTGAWLYWCPGTALLVPPDCICGVPIDKQYVSILTKFADETMGASMRMPRDLNVTGIRVTANLLNSFQLPTLRPLHIPSHG